MRIFQKSFFKVGKTFYVYTCQILPSMKHAKVFRQEQINDQNLVRAQMYIKIMNGGSIF